MRGSKLVLEKIKGQDVPPLVDSGAVLVSRGKSGHSGDPSAPQMTTLGPAAEELLRMEGVKKRFGATIALDGVGI